MVPILDDFTQGRDGRLRLNTCCFFVSHCCIGIWSIVSSAATWFLLILQIWLFWMISYDIFMFKVITFCGALSYPWKLSFLRVVKIGSPCSRGCQSWNPRIQWIFMMHHIKTSMEALIASGNRNITWYYMYIPNLSWWNYPFYWWKRNLFPQRYVFLLSCLPHPSAGFCCETLGQQPVLLCQVVSKGRTLPGFVHCPKQAAEPGPSGL